MLHGLHIERLKTNLLLSLYIKPQCLFHLDRIFIRSFHRVQLQYMLYSILIIATQASTRNRKYEPQDFRLNTHCRKYNLIIVKMEEASYLMHADVFFHISVYMVFHRGRMYRDEKYKTGLRFIHSGSTLKCYI